MNSIRNDDLTIFGIASEIDSDVKKILPSGTNVSYLIEPGGSPCMKIYLIPTLGEPVISPDYTRWAEARVTEATSDKAPCFLFWRMAELFASTEMILQSYGGGSLDDAIKNEESIVFTYSGPFLPNHYLPYYLYKAALDSRMPYDTWKQFWREHTKKARRHTKRYVEDSFFKTWRW